MADDDSNTPSAEDSRRLRTIYSGRSKGVQPMTNDEFAPLTAAGREGRAA